MDIFMLVIYWILLFLSVIVIVFNIPGNILILLLNFFYMWCFQDVINWKIVGILSFLAALAELLEFFVTAKSTQYFGGSKKSMLGSIIGSIIGAIVGSGFLFLIGTLVGAMSGAFIGSFIVDYLENNDINRAMRTGVGAFAGVAGGKFSKIILGLIMLLIIGIY